MRLKKNKGFTLIELLVVIAILGIIVLLAVPRFLGHTENARLTQIKSNVRVNEDMLAIRLIEEPDLIESSGWEPVEQDELQEHADLGQLYDREGVVEEVVGGQYYEVPEEEVTANLDGNLAVERGGKLYYYGESMGNSERVIKYTITFLDADGNVIEEVVVREGESVETPEVPNQLNGFYFRGWDKELDEINSDMTVSAIYSGQSDVELGMENDFEWVNSELYGTYYNKDGNQGYFKYVGAGEEVVEIPHMIQDVEMTSYYNIFRGTGEDVKKVISTNENITHMGRMFSDSLASTLNLSSLDAANVTNMNNMFRGSQATQLDLSSLDTSNVRNMDDMFANSQATSITFGGDFDTSNVTRMYQMFRGSQATTLDLSSFDTSNVTNMHMMFQGSKATTLYLSSFDTSNVTNMDSMFYVSQATSLDLSSFDTSNVTNMTSMFRGSQATSITFGDGFDTSNVTNMNYMFRDSQAVELDLSSFDTSNAIADMIDMFRDSQATTGYARTQDDAKKLNETSNKPTNLTFQVKSN